MYNPYNPYDTGGIDDTGEYKQVRVEYKRNRTRGRKNDGGAINAGGAIIIIIFVVLCLTIFGLLSFTTAFADKKLADRNLLNIRQYYAADASASEKLARIYNFIHGYYENREKNQDGGYSLSEAFNGADAFDFEAYLSDTDYADYGGYNGSSENAAPDLTVFYTTPMNNIQSILSEVNFYYDTGTKTLSYKITEWKVVLTAEFDNFQYDSQGMNLIDPFAWD